MIEEVLYLGCFKTSYFDCQLYVITKLCACFYRVLTAVLDNFHFNLVNSQFSRNNQYSGNYKLVVLIALHFCLVSLTFVRCIMTSFVVIQYPIDSLGCEVTLVMVTYLISQIPNLQSRGRMTGKYSA